MDLDTIPQQELDQIERLTPTDLVIGVLDSDHEGSAAIDVVRSALAALAKPTRAVVVCDNGARGPAPEVPREAADPGSPAVVYFSLSPAGSKESPRLSIPYAYETILALSRRMEARACGVIASQSRTVTPQWIHNLVQPVLELGFDLVAPRYTRHKMEGLLNRSVLAPLNGALYGELLQNPMGPDFGLSGKLLQKLAVQNPAPRRGVPTHPLAAIASTAACGGFQICESHVGVRTQPPTDWNNLSSLLAEVLGPVFLDVERQAAAWQRIRGSRTVPAFGRPEAIEDDGATVDVRRLFESFQLGSQNLQDIWGLVMPPSTLLELKKLSRLPIEKFRMPDDLWAWIVYDFALGHRLRTISRDHLLRSITPLYLGWIASYVLELENAGPDEIEARSQRLAQAYEARKSYLVSRWRWPDRFNP